MTIMKTKIYSILALLPVFALLSACSDVESVVNRWRGEEITLDACMPSGEANTRAGLVEFKDSKDLLAQWQDGDVVQLFACQGLFGVELGKVTVSNISSDRKRATMSTVIPSSIDTGKPYTIFGFCGIEARLKKNSDDTWSPVCTAELKRSSLEDFKAPLVCRLTCKGTNPPMVDFEHFGTYELLHVSNATSRNMTFQQLGYSVSTPWYLSTTQVSFQANGTPTLSGGNSTSSKESNTIIIPPKDTKTIISWYMASGKNISNAQLTANVNGSKFTSQNNKSSAVRIESGHAYHLYATWDGYHLKFDQSGVEEERSIGVSSSNIDFGTVEVGQSKTATFTVYNTGNTSINFIVQSLHNEFDIPESGKAVSLASGKSKSFTVTFSPSVSNHEFHETVTITSDASNGTQYISLSGNSKQQSQGTSILSVSPQYIDFGTVAPGQSRTSTFTVKNTGKGNLNFVIQPLHNEFDIAESGKAFMLKAGESKSFTITFAPIANNLDFQEQVTISSDASNGTQYISLSGSTKQQTTEKPTISVSPGSIDFGTVEVGQSKTETFTVYNTGKVNLAFYISTIRNDFSLPESGQSFTLVAGSSKTFSVTFRPTVKDKSYSESITITNDASNGTQYVSLYGRSKGTSGGDTSYKSCPDNHHPHMIDLGLYSGTKWACCNVGASNPEDYGSYLAWGETSPKKSYEPSNYIHRDASDNYKDLGMDIAGTRYDAATVNWGSPWMMPSFKQMEELRNACSSEWTTINGINGRRFTGRNGASVFFPAAGEFWINDLDDVGVLAYYWSSSVLDANTDMSWNLFFRSTGIVVTNYMWRYVGRSVRPVCKN